MVLLLLHYSLKIIGYLLGPPLHHDKAFWKPALELVTWKVSWANAAPRDWACLCSLPSHPKNYCSFVDQGNWRAEKQETVAPSLARTSHVQNLATDLFLSSTKQIALNQLRKGIYIIQSELSLGEIGHSCCIEEIHFLLFRTQKGQMGDFKASGKQYWVPVV